jgi:hypothetical protein
MSPSRFPSQSEENVIIENRECFVLWPPFDLSSLALGMSCQSSTSSSLMVRMAPTTASCSNSWDPVSLISLIAASEMRDCQ